MTPKAGPGPPKIRCGDKSQLSAPFRQLLSFSVPQFPPGLWLGIIDQCDARH